MSLENYIKNKHALCYLFPEKNNIEAKNIKPNTHNFKQLIADIDHKVNEQTNNREKLWLSSPFDIEGYFCDEHDNNYGLLLSWETLKTKKRHRWYMPAGLLAGDGKEILSKFLSEGIEINYSKKAKEKLLSYISMNSPSKKFTLVERVGWYKNHFVLPDTIYPINNELVLRSSNELERQYEISGNLAEWQAHIAKYAKNNSRLILALSCAFAAPLLKLTNEESGAIHLSGNSSLGKTTVLQMAASVWGNGSFIKQWRVTCNALEIVAQNHNDCLLPLDELAQADSKAVSDMIYMLANNQGKRRLKSDITLKGTHNWSTLILSTGEIDIATKVQEANKRSFAGMEVRFVSLPANCSGYGIFEDLHEFRNGEALSRHLKDGCNKYYGTAIAKYLECLTADIDSGITQIKQTQQEFKNKYLPENSSGQVARVASRFGLISAAGELAIKFGILSSMQQGEAIEAIEKCFRAWLVERGNFQDLEQKTSIAQVKAFLEKYGESRFINIGESSSLIKTLDRAGYRQRIEGVFHYYILPEVYKNEVCRSLNYKQVSQYLISKGFLIPDGQGKSMEVKHLPDVGKIRVYHITDKILI